MIKTTDIAFQRIRSDFPILDTKVHGNKPLVYFDNAATSQKPKQVIEAISNYYENYNSNVHRGVHFLSQKATDTYEQTRKSLVSFVNAASEKEIIFTKGTTDAINLVATSYGNHYLKAGDEILISAMEHHANIVPWQMLCERKNLTLKVIPYHADGTLNMDAYQTLLTDKTKFVAVTYVSNTFGTINPIKEITALAHAAGAVLLVDAAQASPHLSIDVQDLNCDFLCFSAHKMLGPTGIGVLYGKEAILEAMPPYQGGGDMIKIVTFEKTTYNDLPLKFEAGTPNIADGIGLNVALTYLTEIGMDNIANRENELLQYALKRMAELENIVYYGTAEHKAAVISFLIKGQHPYDVGVLLDQYGIAIRTGHHCTQPIMTHFNIPGTCRASFAFYNTEAEIDYFIESLKKVQKMLQ